MHNGAVAADRDVFIFLGGGKGLLLKAMQYVYSFLKLRYVYDPVTRPIWKRKQVAVCGSHPTYLFFFAHCIKFYTSRVAGERIRLQPPQGSAGDEKQSAIEKAPIKGLGFPDAVAPRQALAAGGGVGAQGEGDGDHQVRQAVQDRLHGGLLKVCCDAIQINKRTVIQPILISDMPHFVLL